MSAAQSRPWRREDHDQRRAPRRRAPEDGQEEIEAISDRPDWPRTSPKMALSHNHRTYRTVELRKFTASRQICVCGAHRETGLMVSGYWVGGNRWHTPWKRAVKRSRHPGREPAPLEPRPGEAGTGGEKRTPLLELQPPAIQDLPRTHAERPSLGNGKSGPTGTKGIESAG